MQLTPQDHAYYCDIPFVGTDVLAAEIVENLTIQVRLMYYAFIVETPPYWRRL